MFEQNFVASLESLKAVTSNCFSCLADHLFKRRLFHFLQVIQSIFDRFSKNEFLCLHQQPSYIGFRATSTLLCFCPITDTSNHEASFRFRHELYYCHSHRSCRKGWWLPIRRCCCTFLGSSSRSSPGHLHCCHPSPSETRRRGMSSFINLHIDYFETWRIINKNITIIWQAIAEQRKNEEIMGSKFNSRKDKDLR